MIACRHYLKKNSLRSFSTAKFCFSSQKLKCLTPIPNDLEIAQSVEPKDIKLVAQECGIMESEIDPMLESRQK
jgi:hypothetical protein